MPFDQVVSVVGNARLRIPQQEGWIAIRDHFSQPNPAREVGIVLPVGCGKSGLIAVAPYAVDARRVLVIAPGTRIRGQLAADLRSNSPTNFYERCEVIGNQTDLPETVVIESGRVNRDDIQNCDFAVTNIQQIAGEENRWLDGLPDDFFDLVLVDEAHHNTAASWQQVKQRFPRAKIINLSATPTRADGQIMEGEVIYSFPVLRAIEAGYVKRLRAKMLSPTELRYIDRTDGQERVIGINEVRQLGETDAEFRRGIVMSEETLSSIVDQAIGELRRLREETGELRLKIIASALNQAHCIQITEAFRARGLRAAYVHSREGSDVNERVFADLESHELDVIVQARMLGEGFDHRYLSVAMVGSIFANLGPFVQFVGRVMRSIVQNEPNHPLNRGVVVFHAGANVARRWNDFRQFSQADQDYFADLLPEVEEVDFAAGIAEREVGGGGIQPVEILAETGVRAADLEPIGDPQAAALIRRLAELGVTPEQAAQELRRIRVPRQDLREARRASLNERIQNEAGGMLARLAISPGGRTLDRARRQRNFAWVTSELNRRVNLSVGGESDDRQNFTLDQVDAAHQALPEIVRNFEEEFRRGT
ncbi:DEAD/DEAH box helicase family protein [Bradyrhizobium sp. CIAT3101]|uniref:DEAD/DEAH box helicase n=1 Tax=Bradyrhizobium sp. CIAT3101 TaxID=439387 RepID=UPI0024B1CBBE|nr:DEAD/DEAH box helicase family protein [Bradyrhizobium sp. CIAT3101]WFU81294.1 DEAD/DEAH box helicase family protein [Bradyrhizobium sp. CIAT3101]